MTAAIVGYTNAGKSTLLNRLTGAGILAEDKLFATLDPTTRSFTLADGQQILLTDTVGFINKLPHHLVEAFKSTLEEARYCDIVLNVVDCSDSQMDMHMHVSKRRYGNWELQIRLLLQYLIKQINWKKVVCPFQGIFLQITRFVFQLNAGMAYMNWKRSLEISFAVGEFIWKRCILIHRQESCRAYANMASCFQKNIQKKA